MDGWKYGWTGSIFIDPFGTTEEPKIIVTNNETYKIFKHQSYPKIKQSIKKM